MPIAALLSAQTSRAAENPRSWAMADDPRPSAAPLTTSASFASPELNAMVFCVVDQGLLARNPRTHTPFFCLGRPSDRGRSSCGTKHTEQLQARRIPSSIN
eukprot:6628015-Alexandrium_andersonii.AAC.1